MKQQPARTGKAVAAPQKDVSRDLKTFEALPEKTKVQARLQDENDKTTGPASVTLQKKIKTTAAS